MSRSKLYLAGPLFNSAERDMCERLSLLLSEKFDIYLPHRDGYLLPDLVAAGLSPGDARQKIFQGDVGAIQQCDVFFIILNGRTVDEGAAFELGLAWSLGKICFGYKDDFRQLTASGDNPMIECALVATFCELERLREWRDAWVFR